MYMFWRRFCCLLMVNQITLVILLQCHNNIQYHKQSSLTDYSEVMKTFSKNIYIAIYSVVCWYISVNDVVFLIFYFYEILKDKKFNIFLFLKLNILIFLFNKKFIINHKKFKKKINHLNTETGLLKEMLKKIVLDYWRKGWKK